MINLLKQYGINPEDLLNFQSEEKQLETVKENGHRIQYISNPSEKVQLETVKENGYCIRYISNPSEKVQLEAVKQTEDSIRCISNPSEKVQLLAVKQNGYNIRYISNPSEKVQRVFVNYILQQAEKGDRRWPGMNQYYFHKLNRDVMEDLLKQITIKNIIT
jgi:uncharacterized protein YecE (DUF72 family)